MRDDQECRADPLLNTGQFEPGFLAQFAVERGQRLVEEQELRHLRQGAGQRDALLLPAGEFVRAPPLVSRHLDQSQHLGDSRFPPAALHALLPESERYVARDIEVREEA